MNRDRIDAGWKQVSGKVLEQWSNLRGDEAGVNAARIRQFAGRIQARQAISKEESERQVREFLRRNRDWDTSGRRS